MTTKPFVNALLAAGYISILVNTLSHAQNFEARTFGMIVPITFLSLLVLSAALMGYLFFYQPVRLVVENKPQEAATLLLSTIASFVGITATLLLTWYLLSISL
jgi:hypothetical protein